MPGYPPPRDWSLGRGALLQLTAVCGDGVTASFECDDTEVAFDPIIEDAWPEWEDSVLRSPSRVVGYTIRIQSRGGTLNVSNPRAQTAPKEGR